MVTSALRAGNLLAPKTQTERTRHASTPATSEGLGTPATDGVSLGAAVSARSSASITGAAKAPPALSTQGIGDRLRHIGQAIGHAVANTVAGVRLVGFGLIYRLEGHLTETRETLYRPSDRLPTPTIDRPFVIVPGWSTQPKAFDALTKLLTRNGANDGQTYFVKQGQFYTLDADGTLQPLSAPPTQGRIFEMVWTDTRQSPARNLPEIRANLEAICNATGYDKVDIEGYSMGGLDTRLYIDQGGSRVNRFMMLGTPNHGTRFGDLVADVLDRDVKWAIKFAGISGADRESMNWLRQEKNSPLLTDLNSRAGQQQRVAPTLSVGTDVMPTAGRRGLTRGDGLVPSSSLGLPGGNTIVLHEAMQHGRLNDDPTVQHVRSVFFGWGLPADAGAKFGSDAGVMKQVPRP